jgi:hypothetical protein
MSDLPTPKIQITANMTKETLLAEWQREKGALLHRDRIRSIEQAKRAVRIWRHEPLLHMGQIPSLEELKIQLEKLSKGKVEDSKKDWVNDVESFKDFLKMIAEKKELPEGELDLSTQQLGLGPTASVQLWHVLVEAVPFVEKAIVYVTEILAVFDERLKFFREQQAQVPMWLKEAESIANSAKKPAEKINKLIAEAKELRRMDKREQARKTLEKAIPLMEQYKHVDVEFSGLSARLHAHNVPLPYFPITIREDNLKELIRHVRG